ncbi:MAG: hypothetical protein IPJ77_11855 [Planctomycetes bacterium]|nr:hypothetical protein [Planctomycetota bacterium]
MAFLRIVLACVLLACVYGIVHDQVTARLCIEYFTLAHPPLGLGESPTVLGLAWGVLATWWVGLGLGLALATAARAGSWPKLTVRDLGWTLFGFVVVLFALAMMALMAGWAAGVSDRFKPPELIAAELSYERWKHFTAAAWAHAASYFFGAFGGIALCVHLVLLRWRRARGHASDATGSAAGAAPRAGA